MALYDSIGTGYRELRRPDHRLAAAINAALAGTNSVVNLGAGVGSYEPTDCRVVAVEPSQVMIDQRPADTAPAIRGVAEALPFRDAEFDAAMGVLTMHHWTDLRRGLAEARRVAKRQVFLTWECYPEGFWLIDYFPQIRTIDDDVFPTMPELADMLGGDMRVEPFPIPHDCTDGFMCAYWRRPEMYLDANVRQAISTFQRDDLDFESGLARLAADLESGVWEERYGEVRNRTEYDLGYRLVVAGERGGRS